MAKKNTHEREKVSEVPGEIQQQEINSICIREFMPFCEGASGNGECSYYDNGDCLKYKFVFPIV